MVDDDSLVTRMDFYVPHPNDPPIRFQAVLRSTGECRVFPADAMIFQVNQKFPRFRGYTLNIDGSVINAELLESFNELTQSLNRDFAASAQLAQRPVASDKIKADVTTAAGDKRTAPAKVAAPSK